MELDNMKNEWAEIDGALRLVSPVERARSPLRRFIWVAGLETATGLIATVLLGQFLAAHWSEARFAVPAALIDIWIIAMISASIRYMAMASRISYDRPVAQIQREIQELRKLRVRVTQWALLTGLQVWWVPFLIVASKGIWNVDAYRFVSFAYLAVNVAFGLGAVPVAIWVSKRTGELTRGWLARTLAGDELVHAEALLSDLRDFER